MLASREKALARYRRYNYSEKGRARYRRYDETHPDEPGSYMARYHRLQEEMGCHSSPYEVSRGYRILKALEGAEVVEI